jgi:hypothetical protein
MAWILSKTPRMEEELCDTTALTKSSNVRRSTSHFGSFVLLLYPLWMYLRHHDTYVMLTGYMRDTKQWVFS